MLDAFREGARSLVSKVLIWFVAFTFVGAAFLVWGQGGSQREDIVAKIGNLIITKANHYERTKMLEERLRTQFQGQVSPDFFKNFNPSKMALDALIEGAVQQVAAQEAGLMVTDGEVRNAILTMPQFQTSGVFDKNLYNRMLTYNRTTPKLFEESLKGDLLVDKFRRMIAETVIASDAEAVEQYLSRNQEIVLDFVKIESSSFETKVEVSNEELKKWYGSRLLEFETPEKRDFKAAIFAPKRFASSVDIKEEDLKAYYEENKFEFAKPETVRASHILAQVAMTASDSEAEIAREKIDKALARINAGEDFGEVAKDVSQGPSGPNRGDLGEFPKGQMVPEFENVAFGLNKGEVSAPFRTEFGWHIVKSYAHNQAGEKSFEAVRGLIEERVVKIKSRDAAKAAADAMSVKLGNGGFNEYVNEDSRVQLIEEQAVAGLMIDGFKDWSTVWQTISSIEQGSNSQPQDISEGYVIFNLVKVIVSRTAPLEENMEVAEKRFRMERAGELARKTALEIHGAGSGGFTAEANKLGLEMNSTKPFSRASVMQPGFEKDEGMLSEGFDLAVGEVLSVPYLEGYYVISLKERKPVDQQDLRVKLTKIKKSILQTKANQVYASYVGNLRDKADAEGKIKIYINLDKL